MNKKINVDKLVFISATGSIIIHLITFITACPIFFLALDSDIRENQHVIGNLIIITFSVVISLSVVIAFMIFFINQFPSIKQRFIAWIILFFYGILSYCEYQTLLYTPKYFLDYLNFPFELFLTPNAIMQIMFVDRSNINSGLYYEMFTNNIYLLHAIIPVIVLSIVYFRTMRDRKNV